METNILLNDEIASKVESIKKLLKEDSSNSETVSEYLIIPFLYTSKGDVKSAKDRIVTWMKYKVQFPKLVDVVDFLDENVLSVYKKCMLTTDINQEDCKFPLVAVLNLAKAHNVNIYEAAKISINAVHCSILQSERVRQYGKIVVVNVGDLPYSILLQLTPTFLYQFVKTMMCVWDDWLKKIIIVNAGVIIGSTIRACRLPLPEHTNKRIEVYSGSWECLLKEIPKQSLPIEYGGTNGTVEECNDHLLPLMAKWRNVVLNYL